MSVGAGWFWLELARATLRRPHLWLPSLGHDHKCGCPLFGTATNVAAVPWLRPQMWSKRVWGWPKRPDLLDEDLNSTTNVVVVFRPRPHLWLLVAFDDHKCGCPSLLTTTNVVALLRPRPQMWQDSQRNLKSEQSTASAHRVPSLGYHGA